VSAGFKRISAKGQRVDPAGNHMAAARLRIEDCALPAVLKAKGGAATISDNRLRDSADRLALVEKRAAS